MSLKNSTSALSGESWLRLSIFWRLAMAAEVSFEEGITERQVSGQTIRATLARLGVRWERAKHMLWCWIDMQDLGSSWFLMSGWL
jgi:hypothetical protein